MAGFLQSNMRRGGRGREKDIGINLKTMPRVDKERGRRERTLITKSFYEHLKYVKF